MSDDSAYLSFSSSKKLIIPSAEVWDQLKPSLIDLYRNHDWTAQKLSDAMRKSNYNTTPRMVHGHLTRWRVQKYQRSRDKEALCLHLLEDPRRIQSLPGKQRMILQRYCKEKSGEPGSYETLLKLLETSEIELTPALVYPLDNVATTEQEGSTSFAKWFKVNVDCNDLTHSQPLNAQSDLRTGSSGRDVFSSFASLPLVNTSQNSTSEIGLNNLLQNVPGPLITQPTQFSGKLMATEMLIFLSKQYYQAKLLEHPLISQDFNGTVHCMASESDNFIHNLTQNRDFWRHIKNGVYYLKVRSRRLFGIDWAKSTQKIPLLCEKQAFPLVRDMHAILAPVSTDVHPMLRMEILQAFRHNAMIKLGRHHPFSEICQILCMEEGSDELSMAALDAMLDATTQVLPPEHPELFEFQRMIVRLCRRKRDFSKAERLARSLIENCENLHGKFHINTRMALSEYLYIINVQERYTESLIIAEDVVWRGQIDREKTTPDDRSLYAMEDLAEIYQKLGRVDDGIMLLRNAYQVSLSVRGDCTATSHLLEKLDDLQNKESR